MKHANEVRIVGKLNKDAELRWTKNELAVCNLVVLVEETWEGGSHSEMCLVTVWRDNAELCGDWKKGQVLEVHGRLRTDKWEKAGQTMYTTKIVATGIEKFGRPAESQQRQEREEPSGGPRGSDGLPL